MIQQSVATTSGNRGTGRWLRWRGSLAIAIITAAAVSVGAAGMGPHFMSHDEGLYVVTAKALRESSEYRLINLPSQPLQTKAPPLYPAVLAAMLVPDRPLDAQVVQLKSINLVCMAGTIAMGAALLWRTRSVPFLIAAAGIALLAFAPGVVSSADWLMTEQLFTALFMAAVATAPIQTDRHLLLRVICASLLAGLAALTRSLGLAACCGLTWFIYRHFGSRYAFVSAATWIGLVTPWWAWAALERAAGLNELESYYTAYETSAWSRLGAEPLMAVRMIASNARGFLRELPVMTGFTTWFTGAIATTFIAVGLSATRKSPIVGLLAPMTTIYLLIAVGHPMNLGRYLIPLVPPLMVMLTIGASVILTHSSVTARTWRAPAAAALGLLMLGSGTWVTRYLATARADMGDGAGTRYPFEWRGFQDVVDWIEVNTPRDAVFASGYDTIYAAYTGRRGVRPWVHEPEVYDPGYGRFMRVSFDTGQVIKMLDELGVRYVISDPYFSDGLGMHARNSIQAVVDSPQHPWRLRFTSSDGLHRVYERPEPIRSANGQ